jgi:uncharacterized protein
MSNSVSRKEAALSRLKLIENKVPRLTRDFAPPRFVADVMLGRLAKWLRIAGFDVLYSNRFSDNELVKISNSEGRVLLSRDTRLLIRKAVHQFVFLESQDLRAQIRQIFKTLNIAAIPLLLTRCITCNEALQNTARDSVHDLVPPFVYATQESFKSCPRCGRVFWPGTHRASVIRNLEELMK